MNPTTTLLIQLSTRMSGHFCRSRRPLLAGAISLLLLVLLPEVGGGAVFAQQGTIKGWGQNESGQLGNNSTASSTRPVQTQTMTQASALAAGDFHSLAL